MFKKILKNEATRKILITYVAHITFLLDGAQDQKAQPTHNKHEASVKTNCVSL